jgi:DNA-binding winged helix-turn-helix (wHTH) protein
MNKFELANAIVDISRGEITLNGHTNTVEPKVLSVLMLLVEANGDVVSQEEIFARVWPNSIFSQSSVQRCIALLRKSLGDDAKRQAFIVTHPKRGYSLTPTAVKPISSKREKRNYLFIIFTVMALVMLLVSIIFWPTDSEDIRSQVQESQLISATEDSESQPQILSARYLSYVRDEQGKGQAIWLYDLTHQQKIRLTPYTNRIGSYQWLNQSTLLYADIDNQKVEIIRLSIQLENFDVSKKVIANTVSIAILSNINIFRGFFLTHDNQLIYQAVIDQQSQLRQYDIGTGQDIVLLNDTAQFKPYGFAVNTQAQQIAIIGFNASMVTEVKLLALSGEQLQTITTLDSNIYHIAWQVSESQLLLTQGKKLINLSLSGERKEINYNTTAFIQQPVYDAEGKFIAFTQLQIDSDLWLEDNDKELEKAQSLVNSTAPDYGGTFSPSGGKISYISNRKGFPQIYVTDFSTGITKVVFNNPERKLWLSPPLWHPSKELIISSVNERLLLIDLLTGEQDWQIIEDEALIPLAWYQQENALLVTDLSNNKSMLSKYELDSHRLTFLSENTHGKGVLGPEDSLFKITQHQIIEVRDNQENLQYVSSGDIVAAISTSKGIYLQIEQNQQQSLMFYDFVEKKITTQQSIPEEVYLIWAIHPVNQRLLFETSTTNQDIVLLKLN